MAEPPSGRLAGLERASQAGALLVLNTLLLAVLTLAAWSWYAATEPPDRTYSSRLDPASYGLTSPEEVSALFDDYDRFCSEGQWRVHPWPGLIT